MWSRTNTVGIRQRWGTTDDDPGRSSGPAVRRRGPFRTSDASIEGRVARAFLARELIIDCPHDDCFGVFLTEQREIHRPPGTGSRVVLRCTRRPEDHEIVLAQGPYSEEEAGSLAASRRRGEGLRCPRCETPMGNGSRESAGAANGAERSRDDYRCSWCGVRWAASGGGEDR